MRYLMFALLLICTAACTDDPCCEFPPEYCYKFDVRTCDGDLFSDSVDEDGTVDERERQFVEWLGEQGLSVNNVQLREDQLVDQCEACVVCPTGDQYFLSSYDSTLLVMAADLQFLNFESVVCKN